MKSIVFFIAFVLGNSLIASAGPTPKYPAHLIPLNLRQNVYMVKRADETEFIIQSPTSTVYKKRYVYTILNENGDGFSDFVVRYDKMSKVSKIEGTLYNAMGMEVKKLKPKDLKDESGVSDNNMMDDSRIKTHNFYYNSYPYTIEYSYEIAENNTFTFPPWVPQSDNEVSVEQSSYSITYPNNFPIRYKAWNFSGNPEKSENKGNTTLKWKTANLQGFRIPFMAGSWRNLVPFIYTAPSDFEMENYKGNMENWKDFGLFYLKLNANRDALPPAIAEKVKALTSHVSDKKEKVRILYQFLQQSTRYISVQLGIGGWQTFDAAYVAKNGYGDCKALSNYMVSLLKAAGIPSNQALIYAGSGSDAQTRMQTDFPANQFNHVIVCVPMEKDSIWLECTDQNLPAGYLSDFTSNRNALLITNEGGKVVNTPQLGLDENEQIRKIKAVLNPNGTIAMDINTVYKCSQQDFLDQITSRYSQDKIRKYLESAYSLATYSVDNFTHKKLPSRFPSIEEELKITSHNYASQSGKRIFIMPNLLNRYSSRLEYDSTRKIDIVLLNSYRDVDEIEIQVPSGYSIESPIENVSLHTSFGKYEINAKMEGDKIIYKRIREQVSGKFPASKQKDFVDFINEIYKNDYLKMVLIKSEN